VLPVPTEPVEPTPLPEALPRSLVELSMLPPPVVDETRTPAPWPVPAMPPALLPMPVPTEVIEFSVLPQPVAGELVERSLLPEPAPASTSASVFADVVPEPAPEPDPDATVSWHPPVIVPPPRSREVRTPPTRVPKPERPAPSGARRVLVGVVAVVVGALCVVAFRAFARSDDDADDDVVSTLGPASQVVASQPERATPATADPETSEPGVDPAAAPAPTAPTETVVAGTVITETAGTAAVPAADPTTPTSATPAPVPTGTRFTGVGNDVIDLAGYDLTSKIMVVSHSGVAAFEITTLDQDLNHLVLVESVVGVVAGMYPLGLEGETTPSYLRVDADGEWAIEIKPVEDARAWQAESITGTGAEVLRYEGGAAVLDYASAGVTNFIVRYQRDAGYDLLVNEIGPITGATTMQAGPGIVIVDTEGEWTLTATPA
jgi:hypothetical protein